MKIKVFWPLLLGALLSLPASGWAANPQVRISTSLGDIDIELYQDKAPLTVANFLTYVDQDFYAGTQFHRVIQNFMIQGGGYTADFTEKPTDTMIRNEAHNGLKNERGTIAMARTSNPHSATAQFFINVVNNDFLNFAMAPYGPANTLPRSELGLLDPQSGQITTSNCHRGRINARTLERAANAKLSDPAGYECLMKAILDDPEYSLDRELKACLPMLEQLKQDGKVAKDGTCSDYVNSRHKSLKLVHVNWGYAVFGRVTKGMDVVDRIRAVETGPGGPFPRDVPREAVLINKVQRLQQEAAQ